MVFLILSTFDSSAFAAPRLVSLLPSNTEIVDALGAGDDVVGVTSFEKDAAARGRKVVGDFINPSMETIVSLSPDLVLAGEWKNSRVVPALRHLGLTVLEIQNPKSIADLYSTVTQVAQAIGQSSSAAPLIEQLKTHLALLQRQAPHPPLRTYIEIDTPFWTVGGHDFLSEALCDIGACNVFSDLPQEAGQVSSEAIVDRRPEVILSLTTSRSGLSSRAGWSQLPAIQRNWVIDDVSADELTHPSPKLFDALNQVAQQLKAFKGKP